MSVSCDSGGCMRIARNTLVGGTGGNVAALAITTSGPLVERNVITGGCGTTATVGVLADNAYARLENNQIIGGDATCNVTIAGSNASTIGVQVNVSVGPNETDVHSNTIEAGGQGICMGAAASLRLSANPPTTAEQRSIFRNNILNAGACATARYDFFETSTLLSTRLFENNDLDPTGGPNGARPSALYVKGATTLEVSADAVNALPGAKGNISADPQFASSTDFHISSSSPCVSAGTATGAPAFDFAGKGRSSPPDIGAFQH